MPVWQDKATARKGCARVKNDLAALKSKQLRMYLFLTTLYIKSAVAGESESTHEYTENQSAPSLSSTLGKQVISVRRIRHLLLLSCAVHVPSLKTILDNHEQRYSEASETQQSMFQQARSRCRKFAGCAT